MGFPGGSNDEESAFSAGVAGSIPGSGRSPGEGNGNPLEYSCLENPMDREAWWATVHGVSKSRTRLKQLSMHVRNHRQGFLKSVIQTFLPSPLLPIFRTSSCGMKTRKGAGENRQQAEESHISCNSHPRFFLQKPSPKTIREFEVFEREPLVLLAQSCDKTFSASNSDILVCLASLFIRHMNTIW